MEFYVRYTYSTNKKPVDFQKFCYKIFYAKLLIYAFVHHLDVCDVVLKDS